MLRLATGLARARAGMGAARQQALDMNRRDRIQDEAIQRDVEQEMFRQWMGREQINNQVADRAAQRDYLNAAREDAQLASRENAQAQAQAAAQRAAEERAWRSEEAARTREAQALSAQQAREFQAEQNRLNRENMRALRGMTAAGQPPAKRLPAGMIEQGGSYNALIGSTESALDRLDAATKAGQNVTGAIRGRITGKLGQTFGIGTNALEVSARGALTNIASQIMKERSGGAVTPSEFSRLEPFLPQLNEPEEVARQKLVDLHRELASIREQRLGALEGSGYDVGGLRNSFTPRADLGPARASGGTERPRRPGDIR